MRSQPYRVIIWGPGGVGQACIKQLLGRSDFEVVGVLGYSSTKDGVDIGELVGLPLHGVRVTTDQEAILALDADVVLYTGALPIDMAGMEDTVIRLLESGKNVINATAFHYAHNHDADYVERFETACRRGNVSLHGTGENPGFWFERFALTLTGATTHVEHLRLDEYVDMATSGSSVETLQAINMGRKAEEASIPPPMAAFWREYVFVEVLNMSSIALFGVPLDRVDHEPTYHVAQKDVVLSRDAGHSVDFRVEAGHIHAISHTFTGILHDRPRLTIGVNWFLTPEHAPFEVASGDSWLIQLEGKPVSLRCQIEAYASLTESLERRPGDETSPTYYTTAAALIQAIPRVVGHEPGFVYPSIFTMASSDLRRLQSNQSIVA